MWIPLGLAAATLVSEDASTLSAALLVRARSLGAFEAIAAVAAGIWIGDLGLFAVGRMARRFGPLARWIARRWSSEQLAAMSTRLNRGAPVAILVSRFVPGSRLALYVAAGATSIRSTVFAAATAIAAVVWTAAVIVAIGGIR